jgi:hypothetical protein
MAMTDSQKIDFAFKLLLGVADTSTSKQFFEEPLPSGIVVTPDMIWTNASYIPSTAPTISPSLQDLNGTSYVYGDYLVVRFFYNLPLLPVAGSPNAFYHEQLKDAIPFNYDPEGSYNYRIKNASNFDIAFGVQDWMVDPVAGVLTFFGSNLSSVGITASSPPSISFFKYIGAKGFPSGSGAAGLPIDDSNVLLVSDANPLSTAQLRVGGGVGNTVYTLPGVTNHQGTILLDERLNAVINAIGVIDGGQTS